MLIMEGEPYPLNKMLHFNYKFKRHIELCVMSDSNISNNHLLHFILYFVESLLYFTTRRTLVLIWKLEMLGLY